MANKRRSRSKARELFWSEVNKNEYECPDCGRRSSQLRTGFEVHHKDGNPSHNQIDNLVALCRACHNLREGKKPSESEIELMRSQLKERTVITHTTPLVEDKEKSTAIRFQNKKASKPNMVMYRIRRSKYARLEIDFNTAMGWRTLDERIDDDGEVKTPRLTKEAVEVVNSIMKKYRDEEQPRNSTSALATNYGTDVIGCPPLLPDVCRDLAAELRPIVMNERNWEPWEPTV